ncbi:flagellar basal body rod protein FlgC [Sediminicurvatus halobius]|uniref:Flagellar basal-body rod protein FlgC n=1 Tax=Sediminicurvatus halobius TaxID=2182432 RepID=A0A2U2MZU4_9GAMM|nr:flagellar basal body rod protein FlgC [Spiribacter halobius]PWG62313.1 flagellar basal body rod protein FlgC [Spiribacter halobius]UEX79766.1 flagellar basal body rod protein FlgC [Spiribacter halobius]
MALYDIFNISGSALTAQSTRLNVTASNLANAETVSGSPETAYRARQPVFAAELQAARGGLQAPGGQGGGGVQLRGIVESDAPVQPLYQPEHPEADADGYVYRSNVNTVEEMVNMISASRSYQNNVEVMTTSRDLLLQTLQLGQ